MPRFSSTLRQVLYHWRHLGSPQFAYPWPKGDGNQGLTQAELLLLYKWSFQIKTGMLTTSTLPKWGNEASAWMCYYCYWVQTPSARSRKANKWETRYWGIELRFYLESLQMENRGDYCLQNNHLIRVWMPGSFTKQRGRRGKEVKYKGRKFCKHLLEWPALGRECNFFLPVAILNWTGSWTKAFCQGSLRQTIMYRQYPFSKQKKWETKVKAKETDSTWSQILFFPVTQSGM